MCVNNNNKHMGKEKHISTNVSCKTTSCNLAEVTVTSLSKYISQEPGICVPIGLVVVSYKIGDRRFEPQPTTTPTLPTTSPRPTDRPPTTTTASSCVRLGTFQQTKQTTFDISRKEEPKTTIEGDYGVDRALLRVQAHGQPHQISANVSL